MANTNLRNFGIAEGRLTSDVKVMENSDGSASVRFTVAVDDNYKKNGTKSTQFVPFRAFVKDKNALGPYAYMHKGDLIGVGYEVRNNNYVAKDGTPVYGIDLFVTSIDLKKTKKTVDAQAETPAAETPTTEAPADADADAAEI